jgi:ribosomal protein S18 acetylase RimI-like enzyme
MVVFIALYIILTAYIRVKMHFWHTQPVFHIHNVKYWLNPPGTINLEPPPLNKFVNLKNNTMLNVEDISIGDISQNSITSIKSICQFIGDYYVTHESATYKPSESDILAYLQCSNQPAFFNIYKEDPLPFMGEPKMIGVISARLLNVTLKKKKKALVFPVYYIDNLCVNPGYRKKGIAPEMIQTLYYRISRANPKVNAYLFKREGQLNAIVPLVAYDTHVFDLSNFQTDTLLTAAMPVIEIGPNQLNLFIAFIKEQTPRFDCVVLPDVSSALNLLKLGKIKIYGILLQGELIAVYIFRLLELYYGAKKAVECITILASDPKADILAAGFHMSWEKIKALTNAAIVFIEGTAHSSAVIKALKANPTAICNFKSPTAFFLYNYVSYSVKSSKTLLFY